MDRDGMRDYFVRRGITYKDITKEDLLDLSEHLQWELLKYLEEGSAHAKHMNMVMEPLLAEDMEFNGDGLVQACIKVKGGHFEGRNAYHFEKSGFVGIGENMDSKNLEPIAKAFVVWCNRFVVL